jgi:DNA repair exonuclease SbcCD ATPase subunit
VQAHRDLESYHQLKKSIDDCNKNHRLVSAEISKLEKARTRLEQELAMLNSHRCHACGQDIHDNQHETIKTDKLTELAETNTAWQDKRNELVEYENELEELGRLGVAPNVFYDTLEDALNHRNSLESLRRSLESRAAEADPYSEQISDMQGQALQVVTYDALNELTRLQEHQDFLLKLLTSKDSFVRKKIIDQNLSYLNQRMTHYLDRIGLPHTVKFQNDLTVSIEELGRELDFDNLSRGERTRLILSMSWAFRDVWESLYHPINLLFIDELMDNGLDTQGVENGLALLKKMSRERHKSIWLVSHKDELAGRVENILKVIKENGFTSYNTDIDIA